MPVQSSKPFDSPGQVLRILHLEDNPLDTELVKVMLERERVNCTIKRVETREAFQTELESGRFDLIISDFALPSFDGLSALESARQKCPDIPFIFVSGSMGEDAAVNSLKEGAVDYVLKERLSRLPASVQRAMRDARDRAERRRIEEELERRNELFRQITENVDDLIVVLDLEGKRLFNSPSYRRLLGDPDALIGTDAFAEVHPEDRDRIKRLFRETVTTGEGQRTEYRFLLNNGMIRFIESQGSVIRDAGGKVAQVVVVSRDVTERKQIEAQLFRAQRMENIGALAGGIAHDLNNVLGPILMVGDLLRDELASEESKKMLDTATASAQRGAEMVKQILSFARGVGGERGLLQVGHLVKEMDKLAKDTFPKSIRIQTKVEKQLRPIMGNATQLHQVLLNLCVNARDAMPEGGILSIEADNTVLEGKTTRMQEQPAFGPYVVLAVSDTGTGIPAELLDRIFEPFFTTKEQGKGTGLGLSTVMSIAKNHGGFLEVSSQVGKGTTFKIYLPAPATTDTVSAEGAPPELPMGQGEQILLVEDELAILEITKEMLEAFNYRVLTATDGVEAVTLYRQRRGEINIVVTDLMMPIMDGPALIRALRQIDPQVKVVAISGLGSIGKLAETEHLNVQAFVTKPYTTSKLLTALREVLTTP